MHSAARVRAACTHETGMRKEAPMHSHARHSGLLIAIALVILTPGPVIGQAPGRPFRQAPGQAPDLAHYGTWTINLAKTNAVNNGTASTRNATFTWIYQPEKDGIRHTIYETYPA